MPETSPGPVLSLMPHPVTGRGPVRAIDVQFQWHAAVQALSLTYRVEVDPALLRLPVAASPRRADGLWRHTCLEAFVRPEPGPGYLEFNFAPSGEWAAYRFDARREGMQPLALPRDPAPRLSRGPQGIVLEVPLDLRFLPRGPLQVGLTAVVEAADGVLGYWALRHGPGAPDFHDPESFTLRLEPQAMDGQA